MPRESAASVPAMPCALKDLSSLAEPLLELAKGQALFGFTSSSRARELEVQIPELDVLDFLECLGKQANGGFSVALVKLQDAK